MSVGSYFRYDQVSVGDYERQNKTKPLMIIY